MLVVATARAETPVEDIIGLSGVLGVSDQVRTAVEANGQGSADLLLTALSGWSPRVLEKRFSELLNGYSVPVRNAIGAVLTDERLVAARAAEAGALADQDSDAYRSYQERLERQPPAMFRAQKIAALDDAMQFSEWVVAARRAVAAAEKREFVESLVRHETRGFLLYAYRFTSNDDLDALTALWRRDEMQQWLRDARAALPVTAVTSGSAD